MLQLSHVVCCSAFCICRDGPFSCLGPSVYAEMAHFHAWALLYMQRWPIFMPGPFCKAREQSCTAIKTALHKPHYGQGCRASIQKQTGCLTGSMQNRALRGCICLKPMPSPNHYPGYLTAPMLQWTSRRGSAAVDQSHGAMSLFLQPVHLLDAADEGLV